MDASSTFQDSLPLSSDAMLSQLDAWDLQYKLHSHVPLRTVEDAKQVEADLGVPGEKTFRIKNFYLRDRKKRNYLVTLEQDRIIDLKSLAKDLGVGNMSFGSADRLIEHLGIRPGAVSPLAMITGVEKGVTFYLDAEAQNADVIYMHPLVNDRTIAMNMSDLIVFMERVGSPVHWLS